MKIQELLDQPASRWTYPQSQRQIEDLHALKNLAQYIALYQAWQRMQGDKGGK